MTPEQDAAVKRAEAAAKAEAAAQAETDASAAASSLGIQNTQGGPAARPNEIPIVGAGKAFVQGVGQGVASLPDLPGQAFTAIRNAPALTTNAGIEAAKTATPEQLKERGVDPAIVNMKPEAVAPAPYSVENIYNTAVPGDPYWSEARKVGKIAGTIAPAIVAPEFLAGRVPSILPTLADTAATTATTYGGGKAGRAVDQYFGGSGDKGEFLGSTLGGGFTPSVNALVYKSAEKLFTDTASKGRLEAAREAGVTPDLSLTGNQRAVDWSRGGGNAAIRRQQQQEIDQSMHDAASGVAQQGGGPQPPIDRPIAPGNVGQTAITTVQGAADKVLADANRIFNPMSEAVGRGTAVDPALTKQGLEGIVDPKNNLYTSEQKATAQSFLDRLNADRTTPVDPALDAVLQSQKTRAQANLANAKPGSPLAATAQQNLDQINAQIDANLGASWQQSVTQRAVGNRSIDRSTSYDVPTRLDVKAAQTAGLQEAAGKAGYTPEEFQAVNEQYGGLKGQQKDLGKIAKKDEPGAYSAIFGGEGEQKLALWDNITRNADPSDLAKLLSQNLELRGRGPAAAGRPELPADTGLNTAVTDWWDKIPEEMRSRYAPLGTNLRAKIDANMALIKADARRGGSSQVENYPGVTLAGASLAMGRPLTGIANVVPKIGNALIGSRLRSPQFTRDVITGQGAQLTPKDLARLMASAVSGAQ